MLLALRSSHRGVRLHTFEPEDRAYTSTPTKIGGHCLDHVVGLTLTWRRSLNNNNDNNSRAGAEGPSGSSREFVAEAGGVGAAAAACSTTLEPNMGRFGGLCGVVQRSQHHYCNNEAPPTTAFCTPPPVSPVYRTIAELPPDTHAGVSWRHQHRHQEYGPEWPVENRDDEVEAATALTVAPHDGSTSSSSAATIMARHGKPGGSSAMPYRRSVATAATGHSATLMAILLSKLANSGDRDSSGVDAAAAAGVADGYNGVLGITPPPAGSAAGLSRTELLHHSVDSIAHGLDKNIGIGPSAAAESGGGGGGSWAWKARVDQTPRYSKLRRYDFVRQLGSGSHGTILLVRKKRPAVTTGDTTGNDGILGTSTHSSNGRDCSRSSRSRSDDHSSSSGGMGDLRVLKESQFLPEAVNEARLLLLADGGTGGGGGGGTVAGVLGSKRRTGSSAGAGDFETNNSAGDDGRWRFDVGGVATAGRRGANGGRGYQRGGVVQVRKRQRSFSLAVCCLLLPMGGGLEVLVVV